MIGNLNYYKHNRELSLLLFRHLNGLWPVRLKVKKLLKYNSSTTTSTSAIGMSNTTNGISTICLYPKQYVSYVCTYVLMYVNDIVCCFSQINWNVSYGATATC